MPNFEAALRAGDRISRSPTTARDLASLLTRPKSLNVHTFGLRVRAYPSLLIGCGWQCELAIPDVGIVAFFAPSLGPSAGHVGRSISVIFQDSYSNRSARVMSLIGSWRAGALQTLPCGVLSEAWLGSLNPSRSS